MSLIVLGLAENSIQLVPDGTLLLHLVVIVLIMLLLNMTLFRPINQILEEREQQTGGRINEARKALATVEALLKRYEDAMREARADGYRLMEVKRAEAMREREYRVKSLREELQTLIAKEKEEIDAQVADARRALALEAGTIGREIGSQILGRPISQIN
jgi:F0F1-type ATP synthase membrane subunit b/b'